MIDFGKRLAAVRETTPLTMCITNFVTINDCANIILAAGGTPSMPHVVDEVEESAEGSAALVCNMGAIEDHRAMVLAGRRANELGRPVVLDPVAVGGTKLRRDSCAELFDRVKFAVVRGNASEIKFIASQQCGEDTASAARESERGNAGFTENGFVAGVDVSDLDVITDRNLDRSAAMAKKLASETGAVIAISGAIDGAGRRPRRGHKKRLPGHVPDNGKRLHGHVAHRIILRGKHGFAVRRGGDRYGVHGRRR